MELGVEHLLVVKVLHLNACSTYSVSIVYCTGYKYSYRNIWQISKKDAFDKN